MRLRGAASHTSLHPPYKRIGDRCRCLTADSPASEHGSLLAHRDCDSTPDELTIPKTASEVSNGMRSVQEEKGQGVCFSFAYFFPEMGWT